MSAPKFSIIIPIYRVEEYLDRCVQSAVNQTYTDIEIVLVDDGSPDNCPAMCDEYAKADKRIKVIHKPNGGQSDARNQGIALASGDYIMLLDSDDYMDPDACERLAPYTEAHPDIIVVQAKVEGADFELDNNIDFVSGTGYDYLKKAVFEDRAQMAAVLFVFRHPFLIEKELEYKTGVVYEDEHLNTIALLAAESVIATDVCYYHYVVRDNSTTTTTDKIKNITDIYNIGLELVNFFSNITERKFRNYLCDRMVRAYLNVFCSSNAYKHGKACVHRDFVIRYSHRFKTRIHAFLFFLSPRCYCSFINKIRR